MQEQRQHLLLWWAACGCGSRPPVPAVVTSAQLEDSSAAVGMTLLISCTAILSLLSAPPSYITGESSYLVCLGCLSCPWRAVILYPDRLSSNLTLLFQNLNKTPFCGGKVMIWVSTAEKPGRSKAQLVIDCMKWCNALLSLPTSHCFSVTMLWQLVTQGGSKTSCRRHDAFIFLSAVLPIL